MATEAVGVTSRKYGRPVVRMYCTASRAALRTASRSLPSTVAYSMRYPWLRAAMSLVAITREAAALMP